MPGATFRRVVEGITRVSTLVACITLGVALLRDVVTPESATPSLVERLVVAGLIGVCGWLGLLGASLLLLGNETRWMAGHAEAAHSTGVDAKKFVDPIIFATIVAALIVGLALVEFVRSVTVLVSGSQP